MFAWRAVARRRKPVLNDPPLATPRLPKKVEADPCGEALLAGLLSSRRILWSGASITAPVARLTPELTRTLRSAWSAGRLTRGLEQATSALAGEQKGLHLVDERAAEKGAAPRGERVSRLLLLSNDGAERFYRHVESLIRRTGPRVLALQLNATASELGNAALGGDASVRLLLVSHREAVANTLLSLGPQWTGRPVES
jgi:hypothetical protein